MSPRRRQDRGSYSTIARVLRDGPDFQRLSPLARHALLDIKIAFGPCGIEVRYGDVLAAEMAHTTGWTVDQVTAALHELEAGGWLRREGNVVWIVEQLRFNPHMRPDNANHAIAVQNHVNGLPRLAIVRAFILHYHDYFTDAEARVAGYPAEAATRDETNQNQERNEAGDNHAPNHAPNPADGYGDQQLAVTNYQLPITTTNAAASAAKIARERSGDERLIGFARCWSIYPRRTGGNPKRAAERAYMARVQAGIDEQHLYARTIAYKAFCDATGKTGTETVLMARTFYGPDDRYDGDFSLPVDASPAATRAAARSPEGRAEWLRKQGYDVPDASRG